MSRRMSSKNHSTGFSMIEVLVSLLILCIGILGMAALQTRSIKLTQDSVQLNNATMLAGDLLEMMRSNPGNNSALFTTSSNYYKPLNSDFQTTPLASGESCASLDRSLGGEAVARKDLTCWLMQVKAQLPVNDDLIKSNFAVCPQSTPDNTCTSGSNSSVVMIQIAWQDNSGSCANNVCYYRLRTEL